MYAGNTTHNINNTIIYQYKIQSMVNMLKPVTSPDAGSEEQTLASPVGHMINEVLFEHEAPLFDDVEQSDLHAAAVHPHPPVEHVDRLQGLHLLIKSLIPEPTQSQTQGH